MAVADFTQLEIFATMIETGAVLCITANFAADVRFRSPVPTAIATWWLVVPLTDIVIVRQRVRPEVAGPMTSSGGRSSNRRQ